jgi:hypothetical protein
MVFALVPDPSRRSVVRDVLEDARKLKKKAAIEQLEAFLQALAS